MRRHLVAVAATLAVVLATALAPAAGSSSLVKGGSAKPLTVAVMGDTPYGPVQLAEFPALIDSINDDRKVRLAVHLGDIKSGSTLCADEYFAVISDHFATFKDPLVYTPGDNEWTDCHRPNNGGYDPLERLAHVRRTYFPEPGTTLGGRAKQVLAQAGYPENQLWIESKVVFAAVHVVGSNNGYVPWTGNDVQTAEQQAEVDARIAAALAWIDEAFDLAGERRPKGVVLMMQADTFEAENESLDGFDEIVPLIGDRAADFAGPVLLLQGDTHSFLVDSPYTNAPNLTRIVVEGETAGEWLRLQIHPRSQQLFSWERIQIGGQP
jgi:Calcineurin-like phosphoesterase